jgi:hypothetical protein
MKDKKSINLAKMHDTIMKHPHNDFHRIGVLLYIAMRWLDELEKKYNM